MENPIITKAITRAIEKGFLGYAIQGPKRVDLTDCFEAIEQEFARILDAKLIDQQQFNAILERHQPFPPQ